MISAKEPGHRSPLGPPAPSNREAAHGIERVVSGGQSGVDRAALDVALDGARVAVGPRTAGACDGGSAARGTAPVGDPTVGPAVVADALARAPLASQYRPEGLSRASSDVAQKRSGWSKPSAMSSPTPTPRRQHRVDDSPP
jgi:hypothetical protein